MNFVSKQTVEFPFSKARPRVFFVVAGFFGIGFVLPLIFALFAGFPVPHVQDELSYCVAADTYAHFRLTNPTPANYEHFEVAHVLMEPSYISKYPPLQGIFMAAGQLIFGDQIYGVWLSCGLFAASLFWMMLAWTKSRWAIVGTVQMILLLGVNSYWSQSYWGGMVAAAGGALFLGGFRRLFEKLEVGSTVWMTLGGIILVNSRPFEGTLVMVIPSMLLLVWLLRDRTNSFATKFARVILPGVLLGSVALTGMCYQFYRVTGNPFKMPYSVHHAQYYPTPLFIFQPVNEKATRGNTRIREVYEKYTSPPILDNVLKQGWLPDTIYLSPIYGFIYMIFSLPLFLFSPLLAILLYVSLPMVIRRSKWLLLIAGTVLFTFLCMSFAVWWDQYHYMAPLTSCFVLLFVEGCRQFYSSSERSRDRKFVVACLAGLTIGSIIFLQLTYHKPLTLDRDFSADRELLFERMSAAQPVEIAVPKRATYFKYEFEELIEQLPGKYIAIVSYDDAYDFHDEIVFNKANIENAKLVWAHDLGEEKNRSLVQYYYDRKILRIKIVDTRIQIVPTDNLISSTK
jgi:hypothetical protein